jgi:hypothetical protein
VALREQGNLVYLAAGAKLEVAVDNVILKGLSAGHTEANGTDIKIAPATVPIDIPASSPAIDNNVALVYVGQGNTFEMLGSADLTGNYNASTTSPAGRGGGAAIYGGIFRMTGDDSSVHHNYSGYRAGGVYSYGDGVLAQIIMAGENAEISFNATGDDLAGGSAILATGDTDPAKASYFAMTGNHAKIRGNQGRNGGGMQLYGAGSTGLMSGRYAQISGNTGTTSGGGLYVGGGAQFTMSGDNAAISGNKSATTGGGLYVSSGSQFTMSGENAAISGNEATTAGGGMYVTGSGSQFTMSGENATISGNKSVTLGAGLYLAAGAQFTMSGTNAAISGNKSNQGGGGMYVTGSGSQFTMSGANAAIRGNSALSTGGGGVFVYNSAVFTMSGTNAVISGNSAVSFGGGVFLNTNAQFIMSRGVISGNQTDWEDGHDLYNAGSNGARSYWAAGSTGYTNSHDDAGRIPATPGLSDVDIWQNGGVGVPAMTYSAQDYGVQNGMWADRP